MQTFLIRLLKCKFTLHARRYRRVIFIIFGYIHFVWLYSLSLDKFIIFGYLQAVQGETGGLYSLSLDIFIIFVYIDYLWLYSLSLDIFIIFGYLQAVQGETGGL